MHQRHSESQASPLLFLSARFPRVSSRHMNTHRPPRREAEVAGGERVEARESEAAAGDRPSVLRKAPVKT